MPLQKTAYVNVGDSIDEGVIANNAVNVYFNKRHRLLQ